MQQKSKELPNDIPEIDWARLAAFIDGEGSIVLGKAVDKRTQRFSWKLTVSVHNTDPRLMIWLRRFKLGNFQLAARFPWRTKLQWAVRSKEALLVLRKVLPYFVMKRDQAEVAIAYCEHISTDKARARRIGPYGKPRLTEEDENAREAFRIELKRLKTPPTPQEMPIN